MTVERRIKKIFSYLVEKGEYTEYVGQSVLVYNIKELCVKIKSRDTGNV